MNLHISENAAKWYKQELDIETSANVRFFVRYGFGGIVPGFSLGVGFDEPVTIHASHESAGITFYIEEKDAWYFDGNDLSVQMNNKLNEPEFKYKP
ncbi:HesB/YadR/YfhF family protein [Virgibacillus siamensis]|uniref:HesB/YadR/YfhF family protein n=1 Tax=Virgibacillus siamensis TaxID=480071 RepID=A0ABP3RJM9_9BACI